MRRVHPGDYGAIPSHVFESMKAYVNHGVETGPFLRAVIANDLKDALGRADAACYEALPAIVGWFYCETPSKCWGSRDAYRQWVRQDPGECSRLAALARSEDHERREVDEEEASEAFEDPSDGSG